MRRLSIVLLTITCGIWLFSAHAQQNPNSQAQGARTGVLKELVSGHYAFASDGFNSGVIATSEGVVVVDALSPESLSHQEREAIANQIQQPIRFLVSSTFHNNYSKGNLAYRDVFKIGTEDYRTDLLQLMQRDKASGEEQKARLPTQTYRDRLTLHLGGKDIQILYPGKAHTRGDSIVFVPQDRIVYLSELFFNEQFPFMEDGYGVSWIKALDMAETLGADIFVPGHGPIPNNPRDTREGLRRAKQVLIELRDAVQKQIARGSTEDQAAAAISFPQYEGMRGYPAQKDVAVRRTYKELKGLLP